MDDTSCHRAPPDRDEFRSRYNYGITGPPSYIYLKLGVLKFVFHAIVYHHFEPKVLNEHKIDFAGETVGPRLTTPVLPQLVEYIKHQVHQSRGTEEARLWDEIVKPDPEVTKVIAKLTGQSLSPISEEERNRLFPKVGPGENEAQASSSNPPSSPKGYVIMNDGTGEFYDGYKDRKAAAVNAAFGSL